MSVAHAASTIVDAPHEFVFAQLSDAGCLGRWALGSMDFRPAGQPGVHIGTSLFDGSESVVEIRPHPGHDTIDYLVGSLEERVARVSIRVLAGTEWGLPPDSSIATMTTWRAAFMSDGRWERTRITHELEVLLFKAQIEANWKVAA